MVSRLSQCVGGRGGVSLTDAAAGAEQAVAGLAAEAKTQMADAVLALNTACADYAAAPGADKLNRIHAIVTELHAVAGFFNETHLCSAAKTFADFIEETGAPARCPAALVSVFATALASLQRGGAGSGRTPAELAQELSLLASRALSGKCGLGAS